MKTYKVEIRVDDEGKTRNLFINLNAENITNLASEFQALQQLNQALEHDDFLEAKELIIAKPELISTIKDVIEETEELSDTQVMIKAPSLIRRFIKVLKK